ncbi:MAG: tripartite tricarboxylate transporter substrate binding protein [Rhizobiales bacterium]|nr:tripartite tricarboxylate transporter substrate binding protein [Hyphomicrobiales bacterium]
MRSATITPRWRVMQWMALAACISSIMLAGAAAAHAQPYPSKPVRIICTFAAGGTTDVLARGVARQLSEIWGQQVVVENRAGANTQIGAEHVAKSAGDGYTLMVTSEGTFVMNPSLYEKLPYDAAKDFIPITTLVQLKQVLIVSPKVPVNNIRDLVALARKQPDKLTYGTTGLGSSSHLNMEMLQDMAQVKLTAVHYRGAAKALVDMHGGHIDMIFAAAGIVADQYRAGKLKILAVSSRNRVAGLPELPTIAEAGLPGFDGTSWFGLFAPRGTPPEVIARIHRDVARSFDDEGFRKKFLEPNMLEPNIISPDVFAQSINDGRERWGRIIRAAGLKGK